MNKNAIACKKYRLKKKELDGSEVRGVYAPEAIHESLKFYIRQWLELYSPECLRCGETTCDCRV